MSEEDDARFWRASSHYWLKRSNYWREYAERTQVLSFAVGVTVGVLALIWIDAWVN